MIEVTLTSGWGGLESDRAVLKDGMYIKQGANEGILRKVGFTSYGGHGGSGTYPNWYIITKKYKAVEVKPSRPSILDNSGPVGATFLAAAGSRQYKEFMGSDFIPYKPGETQQGQL